MLIAGAALAAPAPVLEVRSDRRETALPLAGPAFAYSYRQSIYDVTVREELRVSDGRIVIDRAVSSDLRALEYFGWPGAPVGTDGLLAWPAPANGADRLVVVVARGGEQRIQAGPRTLALGERFGEDAQVVITAGRRPLALWLWGLLPWA